MNDEIKEMTKVLKSLGNKQASELYYYITNLQQENERLKKLDENYPIEEELAEAYRREEDYKSRIEKAVEILKRYTDNESNYYVPVCEVIDILKGEDNE